MTTGAFVMMLASWTFVLGLTGWSYSRIFRLRRPPDPERTSPAPRPEPGIPGQSHTVQSDVRE